MEIKTQPPSLNGQRILVVEDNQDIQETLCQVLKFGGFTAVSAYNGKEALEYLEKNENPSLILLDLMMPVMNGWQFMEALEKDLVRNSIPIVIVSAFNDRAQSTKAQGFIKKPVDIGTLLEVVKRYCG